MLSLQVLLVLFSKEKNRKTPTQTNSPTPLFLLIPQGAKEKALQKENAVRGFRSLRRATRATRPRLRKFFEKNLTKNFLRAFALRYNKIAFSVPMRCPRKLP